MISRNKLHTVSSKFNKKLLLALTLSVLSLAVVWTTAILTETHIAKAAPGDWQWQKRSNGIVGDALYSFSITSSADGTKLAVIDSNNGYIYTSTDSGATWTERTSAGQREWQSITSSADGTKLAAVENHWDNNLGQQVGYIYTSTDSGASWTEQTSSGQRRWRSITSSSDGTKLAAVDNDNGYIYTSIDSGASWTEQTSSGQREWQSITSSADGTKLAAVENHWDNNLGQQVGYIYTSTDSGATWTERTSAGQRRWSSITSSADGTKLAAVDSNNGYIYTSTDSGASWTEQTSTGDRAWFSVASSSAGDKLVAVAYLGNIYTGTIEQEVVDPPEPPTPPTSNTANLTTPTSPISAFSLRPVSISTPTGTNITSSSTVPESSLVTQDPNNQYPLGLVNFSFTTNQSSNQVVLTFITNLTPNQVTPKKYNPSTNTYTNLPTSANAVVSETTIDGKHALTLTYTIIDNGELDLDPTAGTISDPVGLAVSNSTYDQLASTGENTQPILLTAVLLLVSGIVGVWYFRRGWKKR